MKKIILLSMLIGAFCLIVQPAMAGMYREPSYPYDYGYKAGNCIMVDQESEADSTHVFTLNPDNTVTINQEYYIRWGRNARCDEIQFHVDHNTPISTLSAWLNEVEVSRYQNMAASAYEGNTVSTSRHHWYFIQNGIAHRIYDWPTAMAWGVLLEDRRSIPAVHTGSFYQYVTVGEPLNFTEGLYYEKINAIWKEGDRDYSSLPTRLAWAVRTTSGQCKSYTCAFDDCQYQYHFPGDPYPNLLDWNWMAYNPGCPLAE